MSTALATINDRDAYSLAETLELGGVLAKSGFFSDTREAAQAVAKILAGRELGIGPIAAMTGLHIINGRVAIGANIMAGAVKRSGKYDYKVRELSDKVCSLGFYEGGKEIGESTFTADDARKAQTKNLDKFPRNMLFARALSNGVRWYCPDVFSTTVYTPDELREDDPITVVQAPQPARPALPPAPPANVATGEVVEQQAAPIVIGTVEGDPNLRYSAAGALGLNFRVSGRNFLVMSAAPELAHLQAGDEVSLTWRPETINGKPYNVVSSIAGPRNADGLTDWEERAARASAQDVPGTMDDLDAQGATFVQQAA